MREPPEHRLPHRERRGDVLEPEACDLLDQVDVAANVARTPRRRLHRPVVRDAETEPLQTVALLRLRNGQADHASVDEGSKAIDGGGPDRRAPRRAPSNAPPQTPPGAPSHRSLPAPASSASTPFSHRVWLSVRMRSRSPLRKTVSGSKFAASSSTEVVVPLTSVLAPPITPAIAIGPFRVRDHEVGGNELTLASCRASRGSPPPGAADDDPPACQRVVVERVQRAAERKHHVVGHVDDVRDRAHAGVGESRLQPRRRLADRHVAEQATDVARAAFEILDLDLDRLVARAGLGTRHRRKRTPVKHRDLTRDPVDRRQIGSVVERLDLEHVLAERQHVDERRAGVKRVVEHHDPGVIVAELELALGEDHPL